VVRVHPAVPMPGSNDLLSNDLVILFEIAFSCFVLILPDADVQPAPARADTDRS
jgi:hypothetical protein